MKNFKEILLKKFEVYFFLKVPLIFGIFSASIAIPGYASVNLVVKVEQTCELFVNGTRVDQISGGSARLVTIPTGSSLLQCTASNGSVAEETVSYPYSGQYVFELKFSQGKAEDTLIDSSWELREQIQDEWGPNTGRECRSNFEETTVYSFKRSDEPGVAFIVDRLFSRKGYASTRHSCWDGPPERACTSIGRASVRQATLDATSNWFTALFGSVNNGCGDDSTFKRDFWFKDGELEVRNAEESGGFTSFRRR